MGGLSPVAIAGVGLAAFVSPWYILISLGALWIGWGES